MVVIGILVIIILFLTSFISYLRLKFAEDYIERLEYICLVNHKKFKFCRNKEGKLRIDLNNKDDGIWSVEDVYKWFSSPSGWKVRVAMNKTFTTEDPAPVSFLEDSYEER